MAYSPNYSERTIISFPRPGRLSDYFKSKARGLDLDQGFVKMILDHYGLELTGKSQNMPNARRNTNLVTETSSGKKILKKYRPGWKQTTIESEHSVLGHLAKVKLAAPRLVSLPDGKTLLSIDGHHYCLFDFIEGKNYSSSFLYRPHRVRMMATSGRMLASLHKKLIGFQPNGQHHLGFRNYEEDRLRDIPWHAKKIEELKNLSSTIIEVEDQQIANGLVRNSGQLYQDMVDLDDLLKSAHLPRTIIHGDYGLHNLLYTDLEHAVPVDYELARVEWRLIDLVSVISKLRNKDGTYGFGSISQFLHAYQKEYPISDDEWQRFPLVWKYSKLMKAVQHWLSYFETDRPVGKLHTSRNEIEYSNWALENQARLAEFRWIADEV